MGDNLETLFEQILHSEQKAQARKTKLLEVRQQICECKDSIKDTSEKRRLSQKRLNLQVQHLMKGEVRLKWLCDKLGILEKQTEDVDKLGQDIKQNLDEGQTSCECAREALCELGNTALWEYDLLGEGRVKREQRAQQAFKHLLKEEQKLEQDLSRFKVHQVEIEKLDEHRGAIKAKCREVQADIRDCEQGLEQETQRRQVLMEEKDRVSKIPQTDHDFVRLHKEVEALQDDGMEDLCQALQQELQQLQQQHWQQELRQQQQQRAITTRKMTANQSQNKSNRSFNFKTCTASGQPQPSSSFVPASTFLSAKYRDTERANQPSRSTSTDHQRPNLQRLTQKMKQKKESNTYHDLASLDTDEEIDITDDIIDDMTLIGSDPTMNEAVSTKPDNNKSDQTMQEAPAVSKSQQLWKQHQQRQQKYFSTGVAKYDSNDKAEVKKKPRYK